MEHSGCSRLGCCAGDTVSPERGNDDICGGSMTAEFARLADPEVFGYQDMFTIWTIPWITHDQQFDIPHLGKALSK